MDPLSFLEDEQVTDPTDFPVTFGEFRDLDSSVRCPICKDMMNAPVLVSVCGHSFCSKCIRECLDLHAMCPQCRIKAGHMHIVKNPAIESIISTYSKARHRLIEVVKSTISPSFSETPQRPPKRKRSSSNKLDTISDDDDIIMIDAPERKTQKTKPVLHRTGSGSSGYPFSERNPMAQASEGLSECPICSSFVETRSINAHIDSGCTVTQLSNNNEGKKAWQNLFRGAASSSKRPGGTSASRNSLNGRATSSSPPPERLPKEAYDTLKDKQIRDRLAKFDLQTTGSRTKLISRHSQWVIIYNANQDRAVDNQLSIPKLRAELVSWEMDREKDVRQRTKAQDIVNNIHESDYETRHQSQFDSLIQQAKASKPPKLEIQKVDSQSPDVAPLIDALH